VDEDSNNILPLAYPCLAAQVRATMPEVEIQILDCNVEQMGWRSLERFIANARFDVFGLGSETVYVDADRRVLRWVRKYHPAAKVVVGGRHYPFNADDVFRESLADVIVRGEGEITFTEWLRELANPAPDFAAVKGLMWKRADGTIGDTGYRDLAPNLDDLPMPAYDLVPVEKYTRHSAFWTNGITIFHGRGCDMGCKFCTFWPQEAKWQPDPANPGDWLAVPHYRTKSVERTLAETELLVNRHKKTLLFFIDSTFELDVDWTEAYFDALLRRGPKFTFWTFSRADTLLRCEKAGTLAKGVRAGWRHLLVGAEHHEGDALDFLHKQRENANLTREVVTLIRKKYPEVITHVTFMGGVPDDDRQSLRNLHRYAVSLKCDIASFHFLTPMPGTQLYRDMDRAGLLEVRDFSQYNWFTPVMRTRHLSIADLDRFWSPKILTVNYHHPLHKIKRLFTGDPENRRIMRIGLLMSFRYLLSLLLMFFRQPGKKFRSFMTPKWYND
jgi:radical SAM superfamily enzyme YgiQ (UPF0313 family)